MLFDTSASRRNRRVLGLLAGLVLLGLVGWGIWGVSEPSGDGWWPEEREAERERYERIRGDAKSAEQALAANPKDEAAAAKLAKARAAIAVAEAFDPMTGEIEEDGGQELVNRATAAWTAYMKLGPAKPDAGAAMQYASFLSLPPVANYEQAARAIRAALVTRQPSSGLYSQLAIFELVSGDDDAYRRARQRSLKLAQSADRRAEIRRYLDDIKADIDAQREQIAEQTKEASAETGGDGPAPTTPKLPTLPTLQ